MCFKKPDKPDITFYEIDAQEVLMEYQLLNITIPCGLFDGKYYYTTLWGIKEAVKYIRQVHDFPSFKEPAMDCDDFAILMKGLMSLEFGISDFAIALGYVPGGYHAYNIARIEDKRVCIEPQNGDVFEFQEKNYQCDRIIQ
jgi:hypothetical protein